VLDFHIAQAQVHFKQHYSNVEVSYLVLDFHLVEAQVHFEYHSIVGKIVRPMFPSYTSTSAFRTTSFHCIGKIMCAIFPS
jgi:hypothetical protein